MTKKNSPSVIHCGGGGREEDEKKKKSLNATDDERQLIQKISLEIVPEARQEDWRNRQRQTLLRSTWGIYSSDCFTRNSNYCQLHALLLWGYSLPYPLLRVLREPGTA